MNDKHFSYVKKQMHDLLFGEELSKSQAEDLRDICATRIKPEAPGARRRADGAEAGGSKPLEIHPKPPALVPYAGRE